MPSIKRTQPPSYTYIYKIWDRSMTSRQFSSQGWDSLERMYTLEIGAKDKISALLAYVGRRCL